MLPLKYNYYSCQLFLCIWLVFVLCYLFEQLFEERENSFVPKLRSIRIDVEQERMKGPMNRLEGENCQLGRTAFKMEILGRFSLTKDHLDAHEAMFQLAFMEATKYALLEEVMKLWETKKLKNMTELAEFFTFLTLVCEVSSLPSLQQGVMLRGLIRHEYSMQETISKIEFFKKEMPGGR